MKNSQVAGKKATGKIWVIILAVICVVAGIVLGVFMSWSDISAVLIALPFLPAFFLLWLFAEVNLNSAIFVLLAVVALLTLIYPVVKMVKVKKFNRRYLLWILPAFLAAVTVAFALDIAVAIVFAVVFYLTLILCLLFECNATLKTDDKKPYKYIRIILYVLIVLNVISVFFENPYGVAYNITTSNLGTALYTVLKFLLDIGSFIINIGMIYLGLSIVSMLREDSYNIAAVGLLEKLSKKCKVSIVYSILSAVVLYPSMLLFALLFGDTVEYASDFSLITILTVCLVIIFAGILKRSIAEHEENKLTI